LVRGGTPLGCTSFFGWALTIPLLIFSLRRSRARKVPRRGPISNLVPVMDELKRATRLYFIQKRNPTKFGEVIPESPQNVFFISRAVPQGGQVRRLVPGLVPRHEPHFFDCSWVVLPILPLSVSGQVKTNRGSVSTALCAVCCVRVWQITCDRSHGAGCFTCLCAVA